jgi:hypothetical protein
VVVTAMAREAVAKVVVRVVVETAAVMVARKGVV